MKNISNIISLYYFNMRQNDIFARNYIDIMAKFVAISFMAYFLKH